MLKIMTHRSGAPLDLRETPFIWFLVFVVQWLNLLLLLALADLVGISDLEELGRDFHEPFRFDGSHVMAILPCREHQLVVHHPFWIAIEKSRGWMNVDGGPFNKSLVTFLRILLCCIPEESRTYGSSHTIVVPTSREDIMFVPKKGMSGSCSMTEMHQPTDP